MNTRLVVACFGNPESVSLLVRHALTAEVIAVALDLSGEVALAEARDAALAAGAIRCHVLDVRDEFLRDVLVPALGTTDVSDAARLFDTLAVAYATHKLHEIAALENAHAVAVSPEAVRRAGATRPRPVIAPLHLEISVQDGVPVAINGVALPLAELFDSLEIITGQAALPILAERVRSARISRDGTSEVRDHQCA